MNREETKQWIRNQIDSSVKIQDEYDKNEFYLCYNNSYLRALKLSTITGQPVNKEDFKGGEPLFGFNAKNKEFWYYSVISNYIKENYSNDYVSWIKIINDVLDEYEEYKDYKYYFN